MRLAVQSLAEDRTMQAKAPICRVRGRSAELAGSRAGGSLTELRSHTTPQLEAHGPRALLSFTQRVSTATPPC